MSVWAVLWSSTGIGQLAGFVLVPYHAWKAWEARRNVERWLHQFPEVMKEPMPGSFAGPVADRVNKAGWQERHHQRLQQGYLWGMIPFIGGYIAVRKGLLP